MLKDLSAIVSSRSKAEQLQMLASHAPLVGDAIDSTTVAEVRWCVSADNVRWVVVACATGGGWLLVALHRNDTDRIGMVFEREMKHCSSSTAL